jgi:hypothetical protein
MAVLTGLGVAAGSMICIMPDNILSTTLGFDIPILKGVELKKRIAYHPLKFENVIGVLREAILKPYSFLLP